MANFNFNKVILGGRLTADPELKTTPSGIMVTTFAVAVNRRGSKEEQKTDFFTVTAWRKDAEFITRFFRKGSNICIWGHLETKSWTDERGNTHHVTNIIVEEANFVDKKSEMINIPAPATDVVEYPTFEPLGEDAGISFGHRNLDEFAESDTQEELPFK